MKAVLFNNEIELERLNNTADGTPRHVLHFVPIIAYIESKLGEQDPFNAYDYTLNFIKGCQGFKKYHNKQYGGGIAIATHDIDRALKRLENFVNAEIENQLVYKIESEEIEHFKSIHQLAIPIVITTNSYGSILRAKIKHRELDVNITHGFDNNMSTFDNYLKTAIIASRFASKQDKHFTYELIGTCTDTPDGYIFNMKVSSLKNDK